MTDNSSLKKIYENVYTGDEQAHYTKFRLQEGSMPKEYEAALKLLDWSGKSVLDLGCGTGDMCALAAEAGANSVLGVDYAESAIVEAKAKFQHPQITFEAKEIEAVTGTYDVVMSYGTLEHMNNPLATLKQYQAMLNEGGSIVITCPNWTNPRGHILQTLAKLFDAPITLADLHYLTPIDFEEFAKELGMKLTWSTVDHEWGGGQKMIDDFKRRLPNVARDAGWDINSEKIDSFLAWIETRIVPFMGNEKHQGAVGVYHFTP